MISEHRNQPRHRPVGQAAGRRTARSGPTLATMLAFAVAGAALAGCQRMQVEEVPPPPPPSAAQPQAAMPDAGMAIAHACGADIDRLCPGVPPGEGRIKACMKAHVMELSAPCTDELLKAIAAEREPN